MRFNVFFYRPDMVNPKGKKINPDLLYTASGQCFAEWQRDEQTVYDYRVKMIKQKIEDIPEQKVFDFWR